MDINVSLFNFLNHTIQNSIFDTIMPIMTHFGGFKWMSVFLIVIIIYSILKKNNTLKKIAVLALIAFLFSDLITFILKISIQEPRPFVSLSDVHLLINESDPNSFPSGHTTSTLSVVTILILNTKKLFKNHYKLINIFLILFSIIIPISRIYVGVHYPFDVIVGGLIGISTALFVNKLFK